jgi:BolA protein
VTETAQRIEQILRERFRPDHFQLVDESQLHAGHAGAAESGGGHYRVLVVSKEFAGRSLLEQHRLVNEALQSMIGNEIHAISIKTLTPEQWSRPAGS